MAADNAAAAVVKAPSPADQAKLERLRRRREAGYTPSGRYTGQEEDLDRLVESIGKDYPNKEVRELAKTERGRALIAATHNRDTKAAVEAGFSFGFRRRGVLVRKSGKDPISLLSIEAQSAVAEFVDTMRSGEPESEVCKRAHIRMTTLHGDLTALLYKIEQGLKKGVEIAADNHKGDLDDDDA